VNDYACDAHVPLIEAIQKTTTSMHCFAPALHKWQELQAAILIVRLYASVLQVDVLNQSAEAEVGAACV